MVDRASGSLAYQKILVLVHKVFPNRGDHNFHLYYSYTSALNSQMRKSGHITTADEIQTINERLIIPHHRNLPQKLERFQRGFIELRIAQNVDGKLFSCLSTRPTEQIPGKQSFSTHSYLFQNSPFSLGIHSEKQQVSSPVTSHMGPIL